jgi:receptor protein-tyrosine kinase/non-specific protein-tyrosine kinase
MVKIKGFPSKSANGVEGIPREFRDESLLLPVSDPRSPVTENYRRLKTYVDHIGEAEEKDIRTLVVTSSREAEGKTLTAVNLALVLAEERDRSVLLVDCDLHRPRIRKLLRQSPRIGLMDLYEDRADLTAAAVPLVKSRLHVLAAGSVGKTTPAEVLKSSRFRKLLRRLQERYDRIVLDTPPVMRFVDANILNQYADGMIFVVRYGVTARQMARRAISSVTSGRILGLVFNDVRYTIVDRYYYRYDEYGKSYYEDE